MSGGFIWYELMTDDVAAAAACSARVVGWRAVDSGLPGPGYRYLNVAGENVDLHTVMLDLERADLGFRTMVQVRNKLLDAYKEVMRLPV